MVHPSSVQLHLIQHLATSSAPDAVLSERFVMSRDGAFFTSLVARQGQWVWRVCRRVLKGSQATGDTFQATFLLLARQVRMGW